MKQVNYLSSVNFNGCSTSQFDNTKKMLDDDLFICTVNGESKNIEYQTLRNQIFNDIYNSVLGIKSMAFKSKTSYALSSHNHDYLYNKLEPRNYSGNVKLFSIENAYMEKPNETYTISATQIYSEKPTEPKPGTLKFVYGIKKGIILPEEEQSDGQFDGWVYADGKEYTPANLDLNNDEFTKLPSYSVMGNNNSKDPKIVVPALTSFFKVSKSRITNIVENNYQIGLPDHSHNIPNIDRININIKNSTNTKITTYTNHDQKGGKPHQGNDPIGRTKAEYTIDISQIKIPEFTSDTTGEDREPKPPHCKLLVMVYIGGRTKPYTT